MIALDSCIFIYILDKNPEFFKKARDLLGGLDEGSAMASALIYTETLAGLTGDSFKAGEGMLDALSDHIKIAPLDTEVAVLAARLRAENGNGLKTADAIHIATALQHGANEFVTNGLRLSKLAVPGLKICLL